MRLIVYDVEVFSDDWLVIFKDIETKQYTVIHNDILSGVPNKKISLMRGKTGCLVAISTVAENPLGKST